MSDSVSVIIPCFKHAQYLSRAIESALAQTYPHVEIIVVDDGSPDDTSEVARRYADRGVKLVRQSNAGLSAARNAGVLASSGDWLLFLDADDEIDRDVCEKMVAVGVRGAEIVHCGWRNVDESGRVTRETLPTALPDDTFHRLLLDNFTVVHTALVRRALLARTGLFDTQLRSREDHEFWLRAASKGAKFAPCPEVLVTYHTVSGSMSTNERGMAIAQLRLLEKYESFHGQACDKCRRIVRSERWGCRATLNRVGVGEGPLPRGTERRAVFAAPFVQWLRRSKARLAQAAGASNS